jgi:hypothetical protein
MGVSFSGVRAVLIGAALGTHRAVFARRLFRSFINSIARRCA